MDDGRKGAEGRKCAEGKISEGVDGWMISSSPRR